MEEVRGAYWTLIWTPEDVTREVHALKGGQY
jgi:hypothetical protein